MTSPPSWMDPVRRDVTAGTRLDAACRSAATRLDDVRAGRARLVAAARRSWQGPHRDAFDQADDDLHDAMRLAGQLLDDLRSRLATERITIDHVNRDRARARARWYEQQAQGGA